MGNPPYLPNEFIEFINILVYKRKDKVMVYKKLKKLPNAHCYVLITDEMIRLISYTSCVMVIDKVRNQLVFGNEYCDCSFTCSSTTRKHTSAFLDEYTNLSYQDVKYAYLRGETTLCLNV